MKTRNLLVAAVALGAAWSGTAAPARDDSGHAATVTWRVCAQTWLDEKAFEQTVSSLVTNGATGKVALFVTAWNFVHHPLPLEELRAQAKVAQSRFKRLRELGYEAGFNILCVLGHLDEMPHTTPRVEGASRKTGAWGNVSPSDFCPDSAAWRTGYLTPALTALAEAKPDFIWTDDDVSVCFCPGCMKRRHAKIGSPEDLAAFGAWLNDAAEGRSRRRAMVAENRASIAEFYAYMAGVVRAVDPKIVLGDMEVLSQFEGMAYPEKYAALGGGKYPTYWRSGCDGWTDETPDFFLEKLNRQARMSVWLPRGNVKFECEIESWPYQRYGKSVAFTVFETLLYTAVATDGAAYNVLTPMSQDRPGVSDRMVAALAALRPKIDAFVAAAGGARPRGVWDGGGRDIGTASTSPDGRWQRDFPWGCGGGFLGTDAQKCGFSVAYREEEADLVAPTALAVRSMSEEELDRMFSGGVYLDADAFLAALARGRGGDIGFAAGEWVKDVAIEELTDDPLNGAAAGLSRNVRPTLPPYRKVLPVVPKAATCRTLARLVDGDRREIAPCVQGVYENARGGRVCVNGYSPWTKLGNIHSIEQMRAVMRWLSRDRLSGCIAGEGRAALWVRGDSAAVAANFGADPEEGLFLDLAGAAWTHGIVPVGVPGARPIAGERRGVYTRYRLPVLAPWSVSVFEPAERPRRTAAIPLDNRWEDGTVYTADRDRYDIWLKDTVHVDEPRFKHIDYEKPLETAFCIRGRRNVVLDFRGATVVLHGRLQPFLLDACENVTIRNVKVRHDRSPGTEGEIVAVDEHGLTLRVDKEKYPYEARDGELVMKSETWENADLDKAPIFLQFFDAKTRQSAGLRLAIFGKNPRIDPSLPWGPSTLKFKASEKDGLLVLRSDAPVNLLGAVRPGQIAVIAHEKRDLSGCMLVCCRNAALENCRLLNGFGMGILPYHCENLYFDGLRMTYDGESPGLIANLADGVHAVSCSGDFTLRNCVIEGTIDDALNVHANFYSVLGAEGDRLRVRTSTCPTFGPLAGSPAYLPGDRIRVTRGTTLEPVGEAVIRGVKGTGRTEEEFALDRAVAGAKPGDMVENMSAQCRLTLANCRFGKANSHLRIETRGKVTVKDCTSEMPMLLTGDMSFWYESSPCEDVTFVDTVFTAPRGCVSSQPEFTPTEKAPYYHGDIRFERCVFDTARPLNARWTRSVRMTDCRNAQGRDMSILLTDCGEASAPGLRIERKTKKFDGLHAN